MWKKILLDLNLYPLLPCTWGNKIPFCSDLNFKCRDNFPFYECHQITVEKKRSKLKIIFYSEKNVLSTEWQMSFIC